MDRFLTKFLVTVLFGLSAVPSLAGDGGKGETVFRSNCSVCHNADRGGPPSIGPNLFGVVGRRAGTLPGYSYSTAMKNAGFTWTEQQLKNYLPAPRKLVPGTKMTFPGLKRDSDIDLIIYYLDSKR